MKLFFDKDEKGNITVRIQQGTILIDFDYVKMIKQLLIENTIEVDWGPLTGEDQQKMNELLDKIKNAVHSAIS